MVKCFKNNGRKDVVNRKRDGRAQQNIKRMWYFLEGALQKRQWEYVFQRMCSTRGEKEHVT